MRGSITFSLGLLGLQDMRRQKLAERNDLQRLARWSSHARVRQLSRKRILLGMTTTRVNILLTIKSEAGDDSMHDDSLD